MTSMKRTATDAARELNASDPLPSWAHPKDTLHEHRGHVIVERYGTGITFVPTFGTGSSVKFNDVTAARRHLDNFYNR